MKKSKDEILAQQKKEAEAFWEKAKELPDFMGSAIDRMNKVDTEILKQDWIKRDKVIQEKYPDYDPENPENILAEWQRRLWIQELEKKTRKSLESILGHKPSNQFTGGKCEPRNK